MLCDHTVMLPRLNTTASASILSQARRTDVGTGCIDPTMPMLMSRLPMLLSSTQIYVRQSSLSSTFYVFTRTRLDGSGRQTRRSMTSFAEPACAILPRPTRCMRHFVSRATPLCAILTWFLDWHVFPRGLGVTLHASQSTNHHPRSLCTTTQHTAGGLPCRSSRSIRSVVSTP